MLASLFLSGCSGTDLSSQTTGSTPPPTRTPTSASARRTLAISATVPAGQVGVHYSTTLTVTSGTAPYTFSLSWGSLPLGMSLGTTKGMISGTPTAAGTSNFGVHVTDSAGNGGASAIAMTVTSQGSTSVTITPSNATISSEGTLQLTALVIGDSNVGVTWSTTQGTISTSGLLQAPTVNTDTVATITAKSVADQTKSASVPVTITPNSQTGSAADFYVAPSGSDSNPGTVDKPFATVAKAQSAVRGLTGSHCGSRKTPVTVQLRGGLYTSQALTFTSADNGCSATVPVVYQNYQNETPILSGGKRITNWTSISGQSICAGNANCWQASLSSGTPYFEAMFYNGQRRFRPRLGATASNLMGKYYRVKSAVKACGSGGTCYDRFAYDSSDPISTKWSNLGGKYPNGDIELVIFEKWTTSLERVDHIDGSNIYLTGSTKSNKDHGYIAGHRYIIENVKDSLEFAGQWFLDRSVSPWTLTYLANPGENPNNDTVIIPQNAQVLTATSLQYVTFQGLQFEHDNYVVPNSGYASEQLDPSIPAMVHCSSCQNVVFDSNRFTQSVGVALDVVKTSTNVTVENNLFYDLGAYGIRFGTAAASADTDSSVAHTLVATENGIAGVGRFLPSSDGIVLGDVHDVDISFNDIYDSYHDGVEICRPSSGVCNGSSNSGGAFNISVHDNNVHDVMQGVTDDGGCYYAMTATQNNGSAKGNKMTHNLCHDVSDASTQDSDGYGGHGMYFDSYTGLWDVEQNLIYRVSGVALNMTQGPQVNGLANNFSNNILAYARQAVVGLLGCPKALPLLEFTFSNNLVYQDRSHSSNPSTNLLKASAYFSGAAPTLTQKFNNNLYWNTAVAMSTDSKAFYSDTSSSCSNHSYMSFSQWQDFGEDKGSSVQNPTFVNAKYPTDDYTLAAGSNATTSGFVPFSLVFGRTNPTPIPSVVGTFPTVTFSPSTDF